VPEGELTFQIADALMTKTSGEISFAPRDVAHTLANLSDTAARYALVRTGRLRAPLGSHGRRGVRGRAAPMGAKADP